MRLYLIFVFTAFAGVCLFGIAAPALISAPDTPTVILGITMLVLSVPTLFLAVRMAWAEAEALWRKHTSKKESSDDA